MTGEDLAQCSTRICRLVRIFPTSANRGKNSKPWDGSVLATPIRNGERERRNYAFGSWLNSFRGLGNLAILWDTTIANSVLRKRASSMGWAGLNAVATSLILEFTTSSCLGRIASMWHPQ